ncbi:MAG: hypothetical protein ACRYG7_51875 [Janthinobacterium lividum]
MPALPACAQVPDLLPGRWEMYQISFLVPEMVPDSVRDHLDDPQVADLNLAIMDGRAQLVVEFGADGSYQFSVTRGGERVRAEAGSYGVAANTLQARSPGAESSSFNGQKLSKLTKRTLVLTFPAGPTLPGVAEEVEYRRLKVR